MATDDISTLRLEIASLKATNSELVANQHRLELQMAAMVTNLQYIKESQERSNAMFRQILFIIGGGFIAAAVAWIVGGGLSLGK
jgi:FtsZ-binding cell division protein ZapB